jgi:CubicO group peptidase (beta-lactamase class C family)
VVGVLADLIRGVLHPTPLAAWPHAIAVRSGDGSSDISCSGQLGGHLVTPDTVMYAASIAKQVVGLLAAQQVCAGTLAAEDLLSDCMDGLPPWAGTVRVRHLAHHTSGLPTGWAQTRGGGSAGALAWLRQLDELETEPGSTYRYSNIGYICLAEIVSRTVGAPVADVAADLFTRLGMSDTSLSDTIPYEPAEQQLPPRTVGDGGLWLSVRDLRSWNDAMNRRALGAEVHVLAETPGTLDDGTALDYAWGVRILQHVGRRVVSHGGSWPTWSAKAMRWPDAGVSVALLTTSPDVGVVNAVALELGDALADASDRFRA